ncbi:MAG: TonB-dependent receptor [Cyclobacteriaceae bacterium]|nr:TonB-dependent receptor [Cyclobacteriaceae bacterium]
MRFLYLVVGCMISVPLLAQENDTTTFLNEVVVSANRWEQNLREVSSRIAKVTPQLIQFQNPQTSADLLGLSNQVFIQKSQLGGGSPMIRGFATNRVLLVVDGVRMNNAIYRSGNLQNVISFDANAVENTEVIFGPGSVIYGSDAIGGVMDFHTLQPKLSTGEKATFSGNTFGRYSSANKEKTGHFDFNIGLDKWAFTTSITYADYDDLKMGTKGPEEYTRPDYQVRDENGNDLAVINPDPNVQIPSGYDQLNLMQKIRFKPFNGLDLSYGFHYSTTSEVPRYDRLILKNSSGVFTSAEWYYGPQEWMMHSLTAWYSKSSPLFDQVKFTAAFQDYSESRHNRNFTGGNRNRMTERFENVKALSFNLDFDKQLNDKSSLFYGAEFVNNTVGSTAQRRDIVSGALSPTSTRYPDGSEWRSLAVYGTLRHRLNEQVVVNAGARFNYVYTYAPYDTTFFDFPFTEATLKNRAVNWNGGLVYNPVEAWKLYGNIATGFRAPNVDDIGKVFDSQPGFVVVPNSELKPEYAYNGEVGLTGTIGNLLTIDVAAFYTYLNNAIVRGPSTFNEQDSIDYDGTLSQVMALQNISHLRVWGIQVALAKPITPHLNFSVSINYQKGMEKSIEDGQYYSPTHVAPLFGSIQLAFKKPKYQVVFYSNLNGQILFDDLALSERADSHLYARDNNGNPYAPSWSTLNLKGTYHVTSFLKLDAGIENILDERYRPYSSGISAPGRNLLFTLRFKF